MSIKIPSAGNFNSKSKRFTVIKIVIRVYDENGDEILELKQEYFDIYDMNHKKRIGKKLNENEAYDRCEKMNLEIRNDPN